VSVVCHLRAFRSFFIAALTIVLLSANPSFAQSVLKIFGQVIDNQGPVAGVVVQIKNSAYRAYTNPEGFFYIYDIPAGRYRLTCRMGQVVDITTDDFEIGNGQPVRRDIYFGREVYNVAPVYVEAESSELSFSQSAAAKVIEVEQNNLTSIDDVIREIPGIQLVKSSATGEVYVSVAGIRPEGVDVLIDGRRLNSLLSGRADLSQLPLKAISKIEYYSSGTSPLSGNGGLGGTINFVTFSDNRPEMINISANRGSFTSENYSIDIGKNLGRWGQFEALWETNFSRNDYEYSDYFGETQIRRDSYINQDKYYLSYANMLGNNHLEFSGFYFRGVNGVPGRIVTPTYGAKADKETYSFGARVFRVVTGNLGLSLNGSYQKRKTHYQDYLSWAAYDTKYDEMEMDITANLEYSPLRYLTFEQGLSFTKNILDGDDLIRPLYTLGRWDRDIYKYKSGVSYNYQHEKVALRSNAAYAYSRVESDNYSNGSLTNTISYNWLIKLGLTSSIAYSYRLPGLAEIHWQDDIFVLANPELKPEKSSSINTELFGEFSLLGNWRLSVGYKDIRYRDLIYWRRSEGLKYKPMNVSKSDFFSTLVSLSYVSVKEYITIDFSREKSVSLNRGDEPAYYGKYITFQPLYTNRLKIKLKYKNPYLEIVITDVSKRYFTEENTKALAPYTLVDLSAGFDIKIGPVTTSWGGKISNLTDAKYELLEYQPMSPRSYNVLLNIKM